MRTGTRTIGTNEFPSTRLMQELQWLIGALGQQGVERVVLEHGWGSSLPPDEVWGGAECAPSGIVELISEWEEQGVLKLGGADITIDTTVHGTNIVFTHHGGIQLTTEDKRLIRSASARWAEMGYEVFEREAPGKWKTLDPGEI